MRSDIAEQALAARMKNWTSQIIIGIVVTVIGTVIANAIIGGSGHRHFGIGYHSGWSRTAR